MSQSSQASDRPERRGFLKQFAALVAGALCILPAIGAAGSAVLSPLFRRRDSSRTVKVASLDALPVGGEPKMFPVTATKIDAWTKHESEPIGAVYLRRIDEQTVQALSATCPHAGCFLPYDGKKFDCPCHKSTFQPDGERIDPATCASPRDMDELNVVDDKLAKGEIWVEFQQFHSGTPEKHAK